MKSLIRFFLVFIIFIFLSISYSLGYSSEYLDFKVPKKYEVTKEKNEKGDISFCIEKDNAQSSIVISIIKHNEPLVNFEYNDENLESFLDGFIKSFNNENNNFDLRIEKKGTSSIGTKPYSCFDILCNIENYDIYQRYFVCVTDNYAYGFILTSTDTDFFHSSDAFTVLNSIEIHDTITTDKSYNYSGENKWLDRVIDSASERSNNRSNYYYNSCNFFNNYK